MKIEFEFSGFWWLPDNPNNKFSGILKFKTDKGAIIEISGIFDDGEDSLIELDIILGINERGKSVTLYKCIEIRHHSIMGFPFKKRYFAVSFVFIGAHFINNEDIKFKKILVNFAGLEEWVNIPSFYVGHYYENGYKVGIYKPKNIKTVILKDWNVGIEIYPVIYDQMDREWGVKQETYITLEPSGERSVIEYLKILHYIKGLYSIIFLEPSYPLSIKGESEIKKINRNGADLYGHIEIIPTELYYMMPESSKNRKYIPRYKMLFMLTDIIDRFDNFLNIWFDKISVLEPCLNLYLSMIYNPYQYIETKFLYMVHAVESYHRRFHNYYKFQPEESKKLIDGILKIIPLDLRPFFEEKLKYINEITLSMRFNNIIDRNEYLKKLFINKREMNKFIRKIIDTRNYLTHYDKKLEKLAANGKELIFITQKIKMIFEICLLKEMNFAEKEIDKIVLRNPIYKRILEI